LYKKIYKRIAITFLITLFLASMNVTNAHISESNIDGLPLNYQIWHDFDLIVYGNYKTANTGINDIKYYHDTEDLEIPLYFKDQYGVACEYRYLGYTYDGNKMPNPLFPKDMDTGNPLEDRLWIKEPWLAGSSLMDNISYVNKAIQSKVNGYNKANDYINSAIDFDILRAYDSSSSEVIYHQSQPSLSEYVNVESLPSVLSTGLGRMLHKKSDSYWYQTFSIPTIKSKEHTPIELHYHILNTEELKFEPGEKSKTVLLEVRAKLADEEYFEAKSNNTNLTDDEYKAYKQSVFYHRYDIKNWEIRLNINGNSIVEELKTNYDANGINKIFRLSINPNEISDSKIDISGKIKANYYTGESSPYEHFSSQIDLSHSRFANSVFVINNEIHLSEKTDVSASMLGYEDFSKGEIDEVTWIFENLTTGKVFSFNREEISNYFVNVSFYNQVKEGFLDDIDNFDVLSNLFYDYRLTQKIKTIDGVESFARNFRVIFSKDNIDIKVIKPDLVLPESVYDFEQLNVIDKTDMTNVQEIKVYVENNKIEYDYFVSGNYSFSSSIGLLEENNKYIKVLLKYTSVDDVVSEIHKWIEVKTSLPKACFEITGNLMENRKIEINNHSYQLNDFSNDMFNMEYKWSYEVLKGGEPLFDIDNDDRKTFLSKEESIYRFTLIADNGFRESRPYTIDIPIFRDNLPAVMFNIYNPSLIRGETLIFDYEKTSLDGDIITGSSFELYYDTNDNGKYDEYIGEFSYESLKNWSSNRLGMYKLVLTVTEDFGHETIEKFIENGDRKEAVVKRYFKVENLSPLTQIYTDTLVEFGLVDLYIVLDESLSDSDRLYILENRIDLTNALRRFGLDAKIDIWDLKVYEDLMEVTTSKETGGAYPGQTLSYNQDGYVGELQLDEVINNSYYEDQGKYVTVTDSKTAYDSNAFFTWTTYNQDGSIMNQYDPVLSPISYEQDGYSGFLHHYSSTLDDTIYDYYFDGRIRRITNQYTGHYQGTVTKSYQTWENNWQLVNDYTGLYCGTVAKQMKQEFTDNFRMNSEKVLVYLTEDNISYEEVSFLEEMIRSEAVVLTINDSYESGISKIEEFFDKLVDIIEYDLVEKIENVILVGEEFEISSYYVDPEDDPIILHQWQVLHNPEVFDNNTGMASFANEQFSEDYFIEGDDALQLSINDKGLYTFIKRVADSPVEKPIASEYSNQAKHMILVHERPIADFDLTWDFCIEENMYLPNIIDKSYDPDFQYRREDKGIKQIKIKTHLKDGYVYGLPDKLSSGSYEIDYMVQDYHNAWSDKITKTIEFPDSPVVISTTHIKYQANNNTFYSEVIYEEVEYDKQIVRTYYAKDFEPMYLLKGPMKKEVSIDKNSLVNEVVFTYELHKQENPDVSVIVASNHMRDDNTLAAGYGYELKVDVNNIGDEEIKSLEVKAVWLENISYEWVYNQKYKVDNEYCFELINNKLMLKENQDSINKSRLIFIPVELGDGVYTGKVIVSNVKRENYYVDESGEVKEGEISFVTIEAPYHITIKGSMYDDINIIS